MNEDKKKKDRSANFTPSEVDVLACLVIKHAKVIESKKTDATTWREKEGEWEKLAQEFNSRNSNCPRPVKSLRTKYDMIKKDIKKKFAAHKQQLYKTGGGEYTNIVFTPTEEKLLAILSLAVEGLPARNDCDVTTKNAIAQEESIRTPVELDNVAIEDMEIIFSNESAFETSPLFDSVWHL